MQVVNNPHIHTQVTLTIPTNGKNLHLITDLVQAVVRNSEVNMGICNLFLRHSSASLVIQENADPDVLLDLEAFFTRLVPVLPKANYRHASEGSDDMPAHIRTALTSTSETIPIAQGKLLLGTWQGIYIWEHRDRGRNRELVVHICGN